MIRRAGTSRQDVDALVALRCEMWDELHPDTHADAAMIEDTRAYYAETLPNRLGWLAWIDGVAVGMLTLLVTHHPPRITGPERRGYVTAVFVAPAHRRRGVARALLREAIDHARRERLRRVLLRTSDAGRGLYESEGFRALEHLTLELGAAGRPAP
jgi:GNAT superfamily N-acetyltransferase